ncbi:tRNA-dihydrouridine(16/17) synthase [NAD(P)(+)]-like [Quercus robur]|uniref:tRNA-dihydrouridine(16/17) synthase [NAD(P)(+)]-like n=1 Tax=Quercus robur TaxID=38942 RepID=UPI00216398C7|nr:tRNA-dihydrouridine(16/17) synthase [NAD(P)(+)]-like [Quercus robur]
MEYIIVLISVMFSVVVLGKIVVSFAITEAAYTPMLHSRIFTETERYRDQEFTTCKEDRPLFVQFCANDPDILLEAAKRVEPFCDYVDINLGLSLDEWFMNLLFCLSRFCFFGWLFLGRV